MLLLLLLLLLLLQATISTSGSFPELPASRSVELRLFSSVPPTTVTANGQTIPYSRFGGPNTWTYDGVELSTIINLADVTPKTTMEVDVNTAVLPNADAVFSGLRVSGVDCCDFLAVAELFLTLPGPLFVCFGLHRAPCATPTTPSPCLTTPA